VRIEASTGGEVSHYLELFAVLRHSGERIVIDGPCYSACTLVLSTIPHNRVCVTRRAILGFHAPRLVDDYGREYLAPEAGPTGDSRTGQPPGPTVQKMPITESNL